VASGRKREFDVDIALNAAMEVFWAKGYVGASLADLTDRMGINKPSMYSAFGNKEALFIKATKHYIASTMEQHLARLNEAEQPFDARLKNYMMSIVATQCESDTPKGCFLVHCQSELVSGDIPKEAAALLHEMDNVPKQIFVDLFTHDPEAIKHNLNVDAPAKALSLYTLLKGTASMARSGVPFSELEYAVDAVLSGIGVKNNTFNH